MAPLACLFTLALWGFMPALALAQAPPPAPPQDSLKNHPVPKPSNLSEFVRNEQAAIVLGKALFWDMQLGSDGKQACASCHFHAGVDNRLKNEFGMPSVVDSDVHFRGANKTATADDFPFHKVDGDPNDSADRYARTLFSTDEIYGSQGVILRKFLGVLYKSPLDLGKTVADPVHNVKGINTRRVEPRQAPTVINAVFNDRQFFDGRASHIFNGATPFGKDDAGAKVWVFEGNKLKQVSVEIDHASLASQSVGPPVSNFEMSWDGRNWRDIGKKMLTLRPLACQKVHPQDSVLGYLADTRTGLKTDYPTLIRNAFQSKWWSGKGLVTIKNGKSCQMYSQMEANFSLFFGLAVQMYESTLVSDDSPFDRGQLTNQQQKGRDLFNAIGCSVCHGGSLFTNAALDVIETAGVGRLSAIIITNTPDSTVPDDVGKFVLNDTGFFPLGVTREAVDLGVGGQNPFGNPLSLARRALNGDDSEPVPVNPITQEPLTETGADGAIKAPTLRNIELTGPYFHHGGMKSLREVLQFYTRGANFPNPTLDIFTQRGFANPLPLLGGPPLTPEGQDDLIAFLKSLTDERVRYQKAPFDHPELQVPNGHRYFIGKGVFGVATDDYICIPAVGKTGANKALKSFEDTIGPGAGAGAP